MARRASAAVAVAAVGLAAGLAWLAARTVSPPALNTATVAAELDARLRETLAGVQARADTLAQLPRLAAAVATDTQTLQDLTAEELAFHPRTGEHIEIAQVERLGGKRAPDGPAHPLLRLPDERLPLPVGRTGAHLLIGDGRLHVAAVAAVEPRDRADQLRGALAVAQAVDLAAFAAHLKALGLVARLELGGGTAIALGAAEGARGPTATVALAGAFAEPARLTMIGGAVRPAGGLAGPFAVIALALAAAGFLWWRPDVRRGTPVVARAPAVPPPAPAPVPPGDQVLDDDTNPDFGPADSVPASARPRTLTPAPTSATMLPASLFETGGGLPPPAPLPDDRLDREYRALFDEFLQLRQTCRQPVDNLDPVRFVRTLRHKRQELIASQAMRDVRFRLAFDNGKAAIRFTPVS